MGPGYTCPISLSFCPFLYIFCLYKLCSFLFLPFFFFISFTTGCDVVIFFSLAHGAVGLNIINLLKFPLGVLNFPLARLKFHWHRAPGKLISMIQMNFFILFSKLSFLLVAFFQLFLFPHYFFHSFPLQNYQSVDSIFSVLLLWAMLFCIQLAAKGLLICRCMCDSKCPTIGAMLPYVKRGGFPSPLGPLNFRCISITVLYVNI